VDDVIVVKDYNMLQWMNVSAYRTSHYPYAPQFYNMADELGIVRLHVNHAHHVHVAWLTGRHEMPCRSSLTSALQSDSQSKPSSIQRRWLITNR
jgi:hypothetical protein